MSGDLGAARADDLRDLLSALLDGELAPDAQARVEAMVAASPEAQEELAGLAQVRTWVRDLPPVDPPFGFYERLLRPARSARRPRHTGAKVLGSMAAAAAAIVLIVGITPASDSVVPPVAAFAARHAEMDPAVTEPAIAPPVGEPADDFAPMPSDELDEMGAPVELTGHFRRMSGYQSGTGAVHLVYSDGTLMVSVYEQAGVVAWESLPEGTMVQIAGSKAWTTERDHEEVMVLERGPVVYTVIAQKSVDTHDDMVEMAVDLPAADDPSLVDRFNQGCRSVAAQFSMGTSDS